VWLPTQVLLREEVIRIKAEAENGWFGLLPHHADFVTSLVPGILVFQAQDKPEEYLAIDRGTLVKCGPEVAISTRSAIRGSNLEQLKKDVTAQFLAQQEREKEAFAYEAKLEADLVRGLLELSRNA
jgi:F-type H+-transporting ATPase subunit epsilon